MIPDIDEALKKLLLKEINGKSNQVDVQFDAPKREWSSRLSKPTLNLFLFDIRKNLVLRGSEQFKSTPLTDGQIEVRVNPVRVDLRYLMSAWVKDVEDEHHLLSVAMVSLLRNPFLPRELYTEGLKSQPMPIPIEVASFTPENGPVDKFTEIWGVLDNEIRPGILVTVTVSFDPYTPMVYSQVQTREVRFVQDSDIPENTLARKAETQGKEGTRSPSKVYRTASGTVKSEKYDTSTLRLKLVEEELPVEMDENGNFILKHIAEGEYHIDVLFNTKVLKRQKIHIPSKNCVIVV